MKLEKYVVARPRAGGTHRVAFEVPRRLRPDGWPPTIPLPLDNRNGRLDDQDEIERINADAKALYNRMSESSASSSSKLQRGWQELFDMWVCTEQFSSRSPATQKSNRMLGQSVVNVALDFPDITPSNATERTIEILLSRWRHTYDGFRQRKVVLSLMLQKAAREGWRDGNPTHGIKQKMPTRHVDLWSKEDVDYYSDACRTEGHDGLGALIVTAWEIGQRVGDLVSLRYGVDYSLDGTFRFHQRKTGMYVTIPASDHLRALLAKSFQDSEFLFLGKNGSPYHPHNLGNQFSRIKKIHPRKNGKRLILQKLRHSCVAELARAGCTVPEIAAVTGHSHHTAHLILSSYLPPDNTVAWNAMSKRRNMEQMQLTAKQHSMNAP